ncbi:MAG: glycosyltransferase 87 family protein [Umezawaea sp.]
MITTPVVPARSPVLLAVVVAVVAGVWWGFGWPLGVDSAVYRSGALALLHGDSLYGPLAATPDWSPELPFAYPPFAAVLFLPLAVLPVQFAWGLLAVATVLALHTSVRLAGGAWWVLPLVLVLEPVWRTVGLGQVNAVLMAMVLVDVLVLRDSRFAGVLIGVAAAVKLTPLVFVAHLLVTGRRADALRALGVVVGSGGAGFVLLPGDTVRYWTSTVLSANSAGSNGWWGNQSLSGLVCRVVGDSRTVTALLVLLVLGIAALLVRDLHRRGDPVGAVLVTAFCGVLVSPISWTHHWVWVVPLCALLQARRRHGALVAVVVLFVGWAFALVPRADGRESPPEVLADNAYVLAALVVLGVLVVRRWRGSRALAVNAAR